MMEYINRYGEDETTIIPGTDKHFNYETLKEIVLSKDINRVLEETAKIKDEIRNICIIMAERLGCTFLISFEESGDILFEIVKNEGDFDFDDIGAELEIKSLKREKKELIKALKLWYVINMTEDGAKIREELLKGNEVNLDD